MFTATQENKPYFKLMAPLFAVGLFFSLPAHAASLSGSEKADVGGSFRYYVEGDLKDDFSALYPDGSVGGQCGDFGAELMGKKLFPGSTGGLTSFGFKLTLTDPLAGTQEHPIVVGDAIVQNMKNSVGHFAVINAISKDARGRIFFVLTESNWKHDGKVSNGRVIFADDASIAGIVRGDRVAEGETLVRYEDNLTFRKARNSAELNSAGFIRAAVQDIAMSSPDAAGDIRDTVQTLLDGGEYAGAIGYLLPMVSDRPLATRLAASLKRMPALALASR